MLDRRTFMTVGLGAAGLGATALALAACNAGGILDAPSSNAEDTDPAYALEVTGAWLTGNTQGDALLVIDYTMTNNEDYTRSSDVPGYSGFAATQNNRSLATAWISTNVPGYVASVNLAPGETGAGQVVFELKDDSSPVTVSCITSTVDYSSSVTLYEEELDPAALEVVTSEASFALTDIAAMVTDDGEGADLLIVDFDFTNLSGANASIGELADFELFQNGVELQTGYLPYDHPLDDEERDENSSATIAIGKTLSCRKTYELRDTTAPVSLVVTDWNSFDGLAVVEKTIVIDESAGAADANGMTSAGGGDGQ